MKKSTTVFTDRRETEINAPPETVFRALCRLGSQNGWYGADWLWRLRGLLDRLVGGAGLRPGRSDSGRVSVGEPFDCWRVMIVEENRRLSLRAEMRLPGEAILDFEIESAGYVPAASISRLIQTAWFLPRGLLGSAYWYAVLPLHGIVFRRMLLGLRRAAETLAREDAGPRS
jgi:uncharacterized protein YndB with AHSA1/START domain